MPTEEQFYKNATGNEQFMKDKADWEKGQQIVGGLVSGISSLFAQQQVAQSQTRRQARRASTPGKKVDFRGLAFMNKNFGKGSGVEILGEPLFKRMIAASMVIRRRKDKLLSVLPPKETKRFVQQAQAESYAMKPIMSAVGPAKTDARVAKETKSNTLLYVGGGAVLLSVLGVVFIPKLMKGSSNQGYDDREDESMGMRLGAEDHFTQSMKDRRDESYGKFGLRGIEHPNQPINR